MIDSRAVFGVAGSMDTETDDREKFVGSKAQDGVWQRIINLIPPHRVFVEPFAGRATIARKIRAGAEKILVDKLRQKAIADLPRGFRFVPGCGIQFLDSYRWKGDEFVYADPPYLLAARAQRGRGYYENEMSDADHARFLRVAKSINCRVMISGYRSPLYDAELAGWEREEFEVMTRGGTKATEVLWWNYPRPDALHDFRFVGATWRDRQRIKKKIRRGVADLASLPPLERAAFFSALVDCVGEAQLQSVIAAKAQEAAAHAETGAGAGGRATNGATAAVFQRIAPKVTLPPESELAPVAVLFARDDSVYKEFPGVDVWDKARDAKKWPGGCPVVAHPPCRAWSALRHMAKPEPGEKDLAPRAIELVRKFGGVLEHPESSLIWKNFDMPETGAHDRWGGFVIEVKQWWWGHSCAKPTKFYIVGLDGPLPEIPVRDGRPNKRFTNASRRSRLGDPDYMPEISKYERTATPRPLADWLLRVARLCAARVAI